MAFAKADLSSEDLLYSFLGEYLDGEVPADILAVIEPMVKTTEYAPLPDAFQAVRGKLQLTLQTFYLNEDELGVLRTMVTPPGVKEKAEATSIESLSRGQSVSTMIRRGAMIIVVTAIVAGTWWKFGRKQEQKFKPLEYLGYEAQALEEDSQERLNLPSHDAKEVRQYLENYPGLEFKARMLRGVPAGWQLDGATVIDYEVAKVAAVMYERGDAKNKEKFFYFNFAGNLSDLPPTEPGNMHGLIYQTYASNELNLLAWQATPGVVSLLVGRRSAPELAEIALASGNAKND